MKLTPCDEQRIYTDRKSGVSKFSDLIIGRERAWWNMIMKLTHCDEQKIYTDSKSGVSLNSSVTGVRIRERTRVCVMKYDNETYHLWWTENLQRQGREVWVSTKVFRHLSKNKRERTRVCDENYMTMKLTSCDERRNYTDRQEEWCEYLNSSITWVRRKCVMKYDNETYILWWTKNLHRQKE